MSIERKIKIITIAEDKATPVLKKTNADLGKLEKAVKRAALAYLSLSGARKVVEFVTLGAQAQAAEYRLVRFAGGAEQATKYVEALGAGSDYTIDRMTALGQASRMLETHMVDDAHQMELAGAIVAKLGNQTWTTERRMQSLTMLLANQSIRRLDDFGLSVENVRRRQEELEKQGYATEQAFKTAVYDEAEHAIGQLGDTSELAATKLGRASASFKDVKTALAMMVTGLVDASGALDATASWARNISAVTQGIREHGFSIKSWAQAYETYWQSGRDTSAAVEVFTETLEENTAAEREQARQMDILTNSYFGIANEVPTVTKSVRELNPEIDRYCQYIEQASEVNRYLYTTDLPQATSALADQAIKMDRVGDVSEGYIRQLHLGVEANDAIEKTILDTIEALENEEEALRKDREATSELIKAKAGLLEQLKDISAAGLARVAMERLTEAYEAGRISAGDYEQGMFAVQVQAGLLDADAMRLGDDLDTLVEKFEGGEISAYELAGGLEAARTKTAELIKELKSIPKDVSSTVRIKTIKETVHTYSPGATIPEIAKQHGGPVLSKRPYWVGEAGPELFIPSEPGYVHSAEQSRQIADQYATPTLSGLMPGASGSSSTGTISKSRGDTYITVTVQGNVLDDRTAGEIADKIARRQRLHGVRGF